MTTRIVFIPTFKADSIRTCITCKHISIDGKCRLFGKVSLVNGTVYTQPALYARSSEMCGEEGMYWEPLPKFEGSSNSVSDSN
jgi:hypothetical protein